MSDVPTKRCSKCAVIQPISEFHNSKTSSDGLGSWCRSCYRAYDKAHAEERKAKQKVWYQANRTEQIAKAVQWQRENKDKAHAYSYRAYQRHRTEKLAYHAKYREEHRTEVNERHKRSEAKKPDYYKAKAIEYREQNREKFNDYAAVRRARQRNAPEVERIDREAIIARDKSICHICRKKVAPDEMSLDHLIPLSRGGSHTALNLAVAHRRCNSRRNAGALPAQLRLLP